MPTTKHIMNFIQKRRSPSIPEEDGDARSPFASERSALALADATSPHSVAVSDAACHRPSSPPSLYCTRLLYVPPPALQRLFSRTASSSGDLLSKDTTSKSELASAAATAALRSLSGSGTRSVTCRSPSPRKMAFSSIDSHCAVGELIVGRGAGRFLLHQGQVAVTLPKQNVVGSLRVLTPFSSQATVRMRANKMHANKWQVLWHGRVSARSSIISYPDSSIECFMIK